MGVLLVLKCGQRRPRFSSPPSGPVQKEGGRLSFLLPQALVAIRELCK